MVFYQGTESNTKGERGRKERGGEEGRKEGREGRARKKQEGKADQVPLSTCSLPDCPPSTDSVPVSRDSAHPRAGRLSLEPFSQTPRFKGLAVQGGEMALPVTQTDRSHRL